MNAIARTWGMWVVRGIASLLFGVLTIARPGASIAAIVFVYGVYALADGALLLGYGFRHEGRKTPYIVRGLLSVAAGLVAFLFPGLTALSFYVLIGAWAITAGIAELTIATIIRKDFGASLGALFVAGALSLACGIALFALPMAGVIALVALIATYAMIDGAALIAVGVRVHGFTRARPAA